MQEWKIYRIGDICKRVCSGGTPKSTEPSYYDGEIPWLNTKEINFNRISSTEKHITLSGLENSSAKWIDKNSVIVAMYGATAAKVAINTIPLTTNQACCNLSIDETKADYRFVYYWLCSHYTELASLANGGAQQNLNAQQIKDFEIKLPEIQIQQKIADLLWSIDNKIICNKSINDNLEQQAQALYKSWFVDFEPFREGEFIESELGLIPSTWRTSSLLKMINVMSGGTPKTNEDKYWNGEIPFFTPKDNDSSIYCHSTEKYITELGLNKCNSLLYPKDTIFVTARGTVGKICLSGTAMAMNQSCYAIVANDSSQQLFWYYTISNLIRVIKNKANGAVFDAITVKDFDEVIVIPDNPTINSFVQRVSAMFESINNNLLENINLAKQRDSLLPKLMSGELKVNEIDC